MVKADPISEHAISETLPLLAISTPVIVRPESPTLLGLPLEVRLQIYDYLLYMPDLLRPDWRYSPCLPYVCRQFYDETIPLLYKNAKFTFSSAAICLRFLETIGQNITYICSLEIWYGVSDSWLLKPVFNRLGSSSQIHSLALMQRSRRDKSLHSSFDTEQSKSLDMDSEPVEHPLGLLRGIRCLKTSQGMVPGDLDAAILKVVAHIANVAQREGQSVVTRQGDWEFDPNWRSRSLDPQKVAADVHAVGDARKSGDTSFVIRDGRIVV